MNPFEAVKRHDLLVAPQAGNGDAMIFPAALRAMGRYWWVVGVVATVLLAVIIGWAFTG